MGFLFFCPLSDTALRFRRIKKYLHFTALFETLVSRAQNQNHLRETHPLLKAAIHHCEDRHRRSSRNMTCSLLFVALTLFFPLSGTANK